ncbi:MAG TPA: VPLPA-CTERM sorting domain-containing protein [Steroidobacteraceae bacterium]|nr:VPLPA-CTERM sorting domain-containing protein [Steroidobacteraceae bacterium]
MKNLVKLGVAGALALSGSMAAHASIATATSTANPGDAILFADVFSGTTLLKAFAGDTGITVASLGGTSTGGTPNVSSYLDANLSNLLASATTGTTVIWALEGGWGLNGGPYMITTNTPGNIGAINALNGSQLNAMGIGLNTEISGLNGLLVGGLNSVVGTNDGPITGSGTNFNPFLVGNDAHTWYGVTNSIVTSSVVGAGGLSTSQTIYLLTAAGQSPSNNETITPLSYAATLTSAGLTVSAVPLPAALWLLGSGLLGLAGVARRKVGLA